MDVEKQQRLLYRPAEVAALLGLGRSTVFQMIAAGDLPTVRFGRALRVPADGLQALIRERTETAGQPASRRSR